MRVLEDLRRSWSENGLLHDGKPTPTFIEEIGLACAENVRSAAICRWMNNHKREAVVWLRSLDCIDIPDDLIFTREETFPTDPSSSGKGKRSRIDIGIYNSDNGHPVAFIEMKWLAEPNCEQLEEYRRCVDMKYPETKIPILLISPVSAVYGVMGKPIEKSMLLDYNALSCIDAPPEERNCIEHDLAQTLKRWKLLADEVKGKISCDEVKLSELFELDHWLLELDPAIASYSTLLRRLMVACLSECLRARVPSLPLKRTLTGRGPRSNDMQADVAGTREFSFFRNPMVHEEDHGMLVNIRFRIPAGRLNQLQVSLGSAFVPYWGDSDEGEFEFCKDLRGFVSDRLKNSGLSVRSGNCKHRWKCSHTSKFTGASSVGDVITHALRLTSILEDIAVQFSG